MGVIEDTGMSDRDKMEMMIEVSGIHTYEGKSRWTLVYKHAMEVPIDDEKWLEKFQNGIENAPPGSSLRVDLEETYITNEDDEIISDPLYRVKKVHKVLFPSSQLKMNFKDMSRKSKDEDSVEQEK